MERRRFTERGLAKLFKDRGRYSSSVREKGISYPSLQGSSIVTSPGLGCVTPRQNAKQPAEEESNQDNQGAPTPRAPTPKASKVEYPTFPRIRSPRRRPVSPLKVERSPSFEFDPSQYQSRPSEDSNRTITGPTARIKKEKDTPSKMGQPQARGDAPSPEGSDDNNFDNRVYSLSPSSPEKSAPATIVGYKTVRRSQVMEEGHDVLQKLRQYPFDHSTLVDEIEGWLDEFKVKVLTDQAKNLVAWWAADHSPRIVEWMRGAVEELEEYTYKYGVAQDDTPLMSGRQMFARPMKEMRMLVCTLNGECKKMFSSLIAQMESGFTWLDRQERQRQDMVRSSLRKDKRARCELTMAANRLDKSHEDLERIHSKMDQFLSKMDALLGANEPQYHQGPSKKRRLDSSSPDPAQSAAEDLQILVDMLTYEIATTNVAFEQLRSVIRHFGPDMLSRIDFDRSRCLMRRKSRIESGML